MSPVCKPAIPRTWIRRLSSQGGDYRYNSDGNSSTYSSPEEIMNNNNNNNNQRHDRQYFSTSSGFSNDDISGRSYVDPWDMENYSFLRKQLEDVNNISPGYDSGQNDIYYVPLDTNGSLQYKRFYGGDVVTKGKSKKIIFFFFCTYVDRHVIFVNLLRSK